MVTTKAKARTGVGTFSSSLGLAAFYSWREMEKNRPWFVCTKKFGLCSHLRYENVFARRSGKWLMRTDDNQEIMRKRATSFFISSYFAM